jgi:hypothetical protein
MYSLVASVMVSVVLQKGRNLVTVVVTAGAEVVVHLLAISNFITNARSTHSY